MQKIIKMVFAASFLASASAGAQTTQLDMSTEVKTFSESSIAPVLTHRKIQIMERANLASGTSYLKVKFPNGAVALLMFSACKKAPKRCYGLQMQANWQKYKSYSADQNRKFISDFNNRFSYIKAGVMNSGTIYASRYIISDYGLNYGTLSAELSTYSKFIKKFNDELLARAPNK